MLLLCRNSNHFETSIKHENVISLSTVYRGTFHTALTTWIMVMSSSMMYETFSTTLCRKSWNKLICLSWIETFVFLGLWSCLSLFWTNVFFFFVCFGKSKECETRKLKSVCFFVTTRKYCINFWNTKHDIRFYQSSLVSVSVCQPLYLCQYHLDLKLCI